MAYNSKLDQYEFGNTSQRKFSVKGFMNKVLSGGISLDQSSKGLSGAMNNPDPLSIEEMKVVEANGGEIVKKYAVLNK